MYNPGNSIYFARILRLYHSFFGRAPDVGGANYWIDAYFRKERTYVQIREFFAQSPEFRARYGGLNTEELVTKLYQNVFNREPDPGGFTYWVGRLEGGLEIDRFVELLSDSPEFRARYPYEYSPFVSRVRNWAAGYHIEDVAPGVLRVDPHRDITFVVIEDGSSRLWVPSGTRVHPVGYYGGTVSINGNWFGSYNSDWFAGYSISDRSFRGAIDGDARLGVVGIDDMGRYVCRHYGYLGNAQAKAQLADIIHGVSGKMIIKDGQIHKPSTVQSNDPTLTQRHPRTGAGVTAQGDLVLIVIEGRSVGIGATSTELANHLIGTGVVDGVALDGGGSSAMVIGSALATQPSDGSVRRVSNQLVVINEKSWF